MKSLLGTIAMVLILFPRSMTYGMDDWPQWRGPTSVGTSLANETGQYSPIKWSASENIAWKAKLPGRGHSSPIVVGNKVFVLSSIPVGPPLPPRMSGRPGEHDNLPITSKVQFVVLCLDRVDGSLLWQNAVHEAVPVEAGHNTASLASATPTASADHVYALFGSHGLYCLDHSGNVVWQKHLGQMHTKHGHGEGASPVLFGDTLVINWDHEEQSFITALDRRDGTELWRADRDEETSWSSPIVAEIDGRPHAIVCGTNRVRGYDLKSGGVIWECGGLSSNIVASPVYDAKNGILVVGSSYEIRQLMAIRLPGASGDITGSDRVLWKRTRATPYVPSPLIVDDGVYFLQHYQNVLTRVSIDNGRDQPGPMRLGPLGNIYASPVSDGRHIFITDLEGVTMVITASDQPKPVSTNALDERVFASLALAGNQILIRGEEHLYCIQSASP